MLVTQFFLKQREKNRNRILFSKSCKKQTLHIINNEFASIHERDGQHSEWVLAHEKHKENLQVARLVLKRLYGLRIYKWVLCILEGKER